MGWGCGENDHDEDGREDGDGVGCFAIISLSGKIQVSLGGAHARCI